MSNWRLELDIGQFLLQHLLQRHTHNHRRSISSRASRRFIVMAQQRTQQKRQNTVINRNVYQLLAIAY
jgi:hypothetical protein